VSSLEALAQRVAADTGRDPGEVLHTLRRISEDGYLPTREDLDELAALLAPTVGRMLTPVVESIAERTGAGYGAILALLAAFLVGAVVGAEVADG